MVSRARPDGLQPPDSLVVTEREWVYRDDFGRRWLVRDVRARERPIVYRVPDRDPEATHRVFRSHDGFRAWLPLDAARRCLVRQGRTYGAGRVDLRLRHALEHFTPWAVRQAIDRRDWATERFHLGPAVDHPRRAETRAAAELRQMARERRHWDTT